MGHSVDGAFTEFDEALNLEAKQRNEAQERHNAIRDALDEAGLVSSSFLQGSFARKTMLKPLKDVDIVIVLKQIFWDQLHGPDGPQKAMSLFESVVAERWPAAVFDHGDPPSAKALRVTFSDLTFDIDLVPAFDADQGDVLIGDREERNWEPSNARRQNKAVSERNQSTDGRFVHQVRELKSLVKKHHELDFVTGIVVESLAFQIITTRQRDQDAIADVLQQARTAVLGPIIEPAGDDDVTAKWTAHERQTAAQTFGLLAARATEAIQLEADQDASAAIDLWHNIFGDPFPVAESRTPLATLAAWNTDGSRTSTGRPTTSTVGRQRVRPSRAWAPR